MYRQTIIHVYCFEGEYISYTNDSNSLKRQNVKSYYTIYNMSLVKTHQCYSIPDLNNFLANNPGILVLKFGATWCAPCSRINSYLDAVFQNLPENTTAIQCVYIDIDLCPEIHRVFKQTRQVNAVPTLLAFKKGNTTYSPDFSQSGVVISELNLFFNKCIKAII